MVVVKLLARRASVIAAAADASLALERGNGVPALLFLLPSGCGGAVLVWWQPPQRVQ